MEIKLYDNQQAALIKKQGRIPMELMPKTTEESISVLSTYPIEYYSSLKPVEYKDIFNSPTCTLGLFEREKGELSARAIMVIMITDLIAFFNVGKTMSEIQTAQTSDLILDSYGMLKIDDFKFCFTNAKKGIYGVIYDRIDGNVIMGWIEQYLSDRMTAADNISYSEHASTKADERNSQSFLEIQLNFKK